MSCKGKHVDLDLRKKMEIIKSLDANYKRKDIAETFGVDISTISKLSKNCDKIVKEFHSSLSAISCKRMHTSVYTDVGTTEVAQADASCTAACEWTNAGRSC